LRHASKLLQTLAALAWGATIIGTFTGYDDNLREYSALDWRIWFCMLGVAVASTLALKMTHASRAYVAMTKAAISRPLYGVPDSGQELATGTGPLAQLVPLQGRPRGRHESQAR
jgi:hypothetical protein